MAYKKTYTLSEFLQMTREKEELKVLGSDEYFAKKILSSKKLTAITTFAVASLMYCQKVMAEPVNGLDTINKGGVTILGLVRVIGYWVALIMCIGEIIKSFLNGNTKDISKIVAKYLLGYGAFYVIPWLFDLIREIFS